MGPEISTFVNVHATSLAIIAEMSSSVLHYHAFEACAKVFNLAVSILL